MRPIIKIIINKLVETMVNQDERFKKIKGIGKIKVISTSKIKNKIPNRKNCSENGDRADFLGLNPHSNGDDFSLSINDFLKIRYDKIGKIDTIRIKIIILKMKFIIFYKLFDWKSNVRLY
jgi:hypothetical protein